jgi:predicted O-methyltransferase YrrM
METLKKIKSKYGLRYHVPMPIVLPMDRERGLTDLFNSLGFKVGAEIGTSKGRYAKWLLLKIKGLKLYCIDPWEVYDEYVEYNNKETSATCQNFYEQAKERLKGMNVEFIRKRSMDAVKDFEDNSLDFVFIDGNHTFEYAIEDIAKWEKKVKVGGIVSGHDYWNSVKRRKLYVANLTPLERMKLVQVKDAIDAWTKTNRIKPWFVTTKSPSWFYVRQS